VEVRLVPLLVLAACAGGNGTTADAGADAKIYLDAPGPDAAVSIALNQTADTSINGGPTVCIDGTVGSATHGNTYDNTWWRAFQLSDYPDIHGGLHVSTVELAVDSAKNAGTLTVKVGRYAGMVGAATLDTTMITPLASATTSPPDTSTATPTEIINVPIDADIPPGGAFVVSVAAPSIVTTGLFYLGGTTAAEMHPGYWSSTACSQTTPITASGTHLIITVAGTH